MVLKVIFFKTFHVAQQSLKNNSTILYYDRVLSCYICTTNSDSKCFSRGSYISTRVHCTIIGKYI